MVIRKVANPAPAVLAYVNPRRKKSMATKRKRTSKRRTVRHVAAKRTPNKSRRHASRRTRSRRVYASRRHVNPVRHHRRRRHARRRFSNPFGGATSEILNFTVAGLSQGIAMPIVGGFANRFLPFGQYNAPVIALGTGWLLSKAFSFTSFTRRFSHPALVFGAATAAMMVLQPIVSRALASATAQAPVMNGPGRRMVRGIGLQTGVPPSGVPLPPSRQGNNAQTMAGMGQRPGVWVR